MSLSSCVEDKHPSGIVDVFLDTGPTDTGITTVDTGGGTGDTGGGGGTGHGFPGVAADCGVLSTVTASDFTDTMYSDPLAPPGTECRCTVSIEGFEELATALRIEVWGDAPDTDGDGVGDDGNVPQAMVVQAPLWTASGFGSTSYAAGYDSWSGKVGASSIPSGYTIDDVNGTWSVSLTERTRHSIAGDPTVFFASCADYQNVTLTVDYPDRVAPIAPPPTTAPGGGAEDALNCAPGASASTSFQLVDLPNHHRPMLLAQGGSQRFAGSELSAVTVTDWHNTDQLILRHGPHLVTLTPSSPTVTLPAGTFPLGANDWFPDRTAGDGLVWQNPVVTLTHQCPASPAPAVSVVQGYGLDLATLDSTVSAATGSTGLADLVTTGTAATWPVYAVRITDSGGGAGSAALLRLELTGTQGVLMLPLVQTGTDSWSLDVVRTGYTLHGTVSRTTTGLSLALSAGTVGSGSSPLILQATTVTLAPLPTNTTVAQ